MDFQGIHDRLRALKVPGVMGADEPRASEPGHAKKDDKGRGGDAFLLVDPQRLPEVLRVCRDDPRLRFELLIDLTATDPSKDSPNLWVNVSLLSIAHKQRLALKALLPKSAASLPTATSVYRAAQWHERECAEMYG